MTNNTPLSPTSSHSATVGTGTGSQDAASRVRDVRGTAGEAVAKLTDVAQQTGQQAKDALFLPGLGGQSKSQGMLNKQISMGPGLVGDIAESIMIAADHLE